MNGRVYSHSERLTRLLVGDSSPQGIEAMSNLRRRFHSIKAVFNATRKELLEVPGIDDAMVNRIHAVRGLAEGGILPMPKTKPTGPRPGWE